MRKWIQKRSKKTEMSVIRSWLLTYEMRLKDVLSGIFPLGVYILFWFSVILDLSSTMLTMKLIPQTRWIEANPLFYALGPIQFFVISILINAALFLLSKHHQAQWRRGASLLFISILVHGSLGMKNLTQLLRLQM